MKIYTLRPVYDERGNSAYQTLEPAHKTDPLGRHLFNGLPKADEWTSNDTEVVVADEHRPSSNFPFLKGSVLVADGRAQSELYPILASAGELLPLRTLDGTPYTLVNLLPLFDCVDRDRSEWKRLPSGKAMSVQRYEFDKARLPSRSLFKTDLRPGEIFATQGHLPPEAEFKVQVERLGLTGVRFREVWNDDGDPIERIELFEDVKGFRK